MARNVIGIRQLGEEVCWMLIQQALGMPDIKMNSNFLTDKVAMLLFARPSLPERLCCTAAVRQMDGTTIYEGSSPEEWQSQDAQFQTHLLPIFTYYLDCLYLYGMPLDEEKVKNADLGFPVINAGNWDKHPAHALADVATMLHAAKKLEDVEAAWVGAPNGTLYSIIELLKWFPFTLRISVPPEDETEALLNRVSEFRKHAHLCASPEEAVKNARFIYAGRKVKTDADQRLWKITPGLMKKAAGNVKLLLSASPIRAIPIDKDILDSHASLLSKQAEYRLAIHKRMLHWVFG